MKLSATFHLAIAAGCLGVTPASAAAVCTGEALDGGGGGELGEREEGAIQAQSAAHSEAIGGVLALRV